MKKFLFIFMTLFFLLNGVVEANSSFNVKLDGKNTTVNMVKVSIDNEPLISDFAPYVVNGRTFVPIREISESLGATVDWDNKVKSATIKLDEKEIKLKIDSNIIYVDGTKSKIDDNSIPKFVSYTLPNSETKTMVPLRFISEAFGYEVLWESKSNLASIITEEGKSLEKEEDLKIEKDMEETVKTESISTDNNSYFSNFEKEEAENIGKRDKDDVYTAAGLDVTIEEEKRTVEVTDKITAEGPLNIVIDPGHGGKDNGATALDGTYEKELNLKVSKELYDKLKANGYNVTLTRTSDEYVKLLDRASESNNSDAEIFLSIHFNSSEIEDAKGIEVLYASEDDVLIKTVKQKTLANELLKSLTKETGLNSRGVKNRSDLVVLSKTKNVSALAELGFISNEEDLKSIKNDNFIEKLVNGLYNGLVNYIDNYVIIN
ncbi:N-acetylmuramoyl-L-alanine amidase [Anaerosphaera multitolerans]|uniref:N-acetylmuramoyl-L-alanine amidase n=1 Tax=Anaerosphaera multitolerans TaxID=2487351 RepID=A0A437S8T5_9FIRM|nr:N-acetylmuramoyl-L-alanine amidase [Anaerosphaera multitolerans]RVU55304.1 N-acetylmuramoyl-L-alanine amidase [Anaerosphaera multitolerans]